MRIVNLSQILSPAQLKEVERILKSSTNSIERVKRLKDYYGTFREDLEKQDILPEYLAYCTEWAATQNVGKPKTER